MTKDFLSIADWSEQEIRETLDLARQMKSGRLAPRPLEGKTAALIFHKPSLRTRMSFETGVFELGGEAMFITDAEIKLGVRESIADVGRVLSRYVGLITIRTFEHNHVIELAKHATVPVINALTDQFHPCQVMADILTAQDHLGRIDDLVVAFMGDGNNVFHSWANLAARIPLDLRLGTSPETLPDPEVVEFARSAGKSKITVTHDPDEAVADADIVYTDVWASMGEKDLTDQRQKALSKFQVNSDLVRKAKKSAIVMHCLPAERGREITNTVMESPQSVVFDEAENRLHAQKAIIVQLLKRRT
jgi:ornithine carbamoyltransferase